MIKIKRIEQGWPGHFIAAHRCAFRRNTALVISSEMNPLKVIIVSTLGVLIIPELEQGVMHIGPDRFYETMAFEAITRDGRWLSDTSKEVHFDSSWYIKEYNQSTDSKANEMHETVVNELILRMKKD